MKIFNCTLIRVFSCNYLHIDTAVQYEFQPLAGVILHLKKLHV